MAQNHRIPRMSPFDLTAFDVLSKIRHKALAEKKAFSPAPGVEQAVMAQAQQGPPPDAMAGGAPGGPPPGAGGPPPGGDPSGGGAPQGAPPMDAGVGGPQDPTAAKLDQLIQLLSQNGGAAGGKPATANMKFEPHHMTQFVREISALRSVVQQMAESMGIHVPAAELFNAANPGGVSVPGSPGQDQGAQAGGGAPQGPPPSQIAQQLPNLPPVAGKSAADINKISAGWPVSAHVGRPVSGGIKMAAALAAIRKAKLK